jgi:hypothetical protein
MSRGGLKLVCNVNIVYGNLRFENSQDYAQKPQRNCMFMNSASVLSDTIVQNHLRKKLKLKTRNSVQLCTMYSSK